MTVTYRPLEGSGSRGIVGLEGFAPGPVFSDAVRIDLIEVQSFFVESKMQGCFG